MSDSSDPMDCSLQGSSVHGIFQARVLERGAIAFSKRNIYIYFFFFSSFFHEKFIQKQNPSKLLRGVKAGLILKW